MAMLKLQDRIPAFDGLTPEGTYIHVDHYLGQKLWLCLYRYAGCPLCSLHLAEVHRRFAALTRSGIQVLAVFDSPAGRFLGKADRPKLDRSLVPMIADPLHRIHSVLCARRSALAFLSPISWVAWVRAWFLGFRQGAVDGDFRQLPAHFLVNADGVIQDAYYGRHAADHIPWSRVERFAGGRLAASEVALDRSFTPVRQKVETVATPPVFDPSRPLREVPDEISSIKLSFSEKELKELSGDDLFENVRTIERSKYTRKPPPSRDRSDDEF